MATISTNKNLTEVTYAQAETLTITSGAVLTVNSTPTTMPGNITCITSGKLRIENSSDTVPLVFNLYDMIHDFRFEGNGVFEVRGAPMILGQGNDAGQTWDFTTLYGGVIPEVTYIDVETSPGSNVYEPWPIYHQDTLYDTSVAANRIYGGVNDTAFAGAAHRVSRGFFWSDTNKTLSVGYNTTVPVPSGSNIRIPNIYISNRLTNTESYLYSVSTVGVPTGGTFTLTIEGKGTTGNIAYNASLATIDAALEGIAGMGAGTITSSGGPLPTTVFITYAGSMANNRHSLRVGTQSLTGGTTPYVYVLEAAGTNLSLVDLSPSGSGDFEWCCFSNKIRIVTDIFKMARFVNTGVGGDSFQLNNTNGSVEINSLCVGKNPRSIQGTTQISSVLGPCSVRNLVSVGKPGTVGLILNNLPGFSYGENITQILYGARTAVSNRAINITSFPSDVVVKDLYAAGAQINFTNCANVIFNGISYADGIGSVQISTNVMSAIGTTNCANVVMSRLRNFGPMAPRNYLLATDAASINLKLYDVDFDCANNTLSPVLQQSGGLEIKNAVVKNLRTGPLIDLPTTYLGNKLLVSKMIATFSTAQLTAGLDAGQDNVYDVVASSVAGITETFSGINNYVGGNFVDTSLTPTTGHITFGPIAAGNGLELTGSAFTNQLGGLYLPTALDSAVITIPYPLHAITGMQDVMPVLWIDGPDIKTNVFIVIAPGVPTGGTFTISMFNEAGTLLGTTSALAYNATTTVIDTAVEAIPGIGASNVTVAGALSTGLTITLAGSIAANRYSMSVNGTALTGGTEPGIAYCHGRAALGTQQSFGSNGMTAEFAMRVPGYSWPSYQSFTKENLITAFSNLSLDGYSSSDTGLEIRLRLTTLVTNPYTVVTQISIPTTVDVSSWTPGDAFITIRGANNTDVVILKTLLGTTIATFTGSGIKYFTVGDYFGSDFYIERYNSSMLMLASTYLNQKKVRYGDNGYGDVFVGAQVQLAESSDIFNVKTQLDTNIPLLAKQASLTAISDAAIESKNAAIDGRNAALDAKKAASMAATLSA